VLSPRINVYVPTIQSAYDNAFGTFDSTDHGVCWCISPDSPLVACGFQFTAVQDDISFGIDNYQGSVHAESIQFRESQHNPVNINSKSNL
jgi:hypothetical protein